MRTIAAILKMTFSVLALCPAAAMAQAVPSASSAAPAGADGAILQKALEANAKGECPADLMGAGLLAACQQQISAIQPMLATKGKITRLEFLGPQGPDGQAELWLVVYEHGAQLWGIAVGPDGKIAGMGTHDS